MALGLQEIVASLSVSLVSSLALKSHQSLIRRENGLGKLHRRQEREAFPLHRSRFGPCPTSGLRLVQVRGFLEAANDHLVAPSLWLQTPDAAIKRKADLLEGPQKGKTDN